MEIIKPGKLPEEEKRTAKCSHCGCEFSFTLKETKYESDPREGSYRTVKCPQPGCGWNKTIQP